MFVDLKIMNNYQENPEFIQENPEFDVKKPKYTPFMVMNFL